MPVFVCVCVSLFYMCMCLFVYTKHVQGALFGSMAFCLVRKTLCAYLHVCKKMFVHFYICVYKALSVFVLCHACA